MKTFSPAYLAHCRQPFTTLALCWRVQKKNGDYILGTEAARPIVIDGTDRPGIYRPTAGIMGSAMALTSDMSVPNMDVTGALAETGDVLNISVYDIESGLLDRAAVEVFAVNWQDPDEFQDVIGRGYLGEISRTSESAYRTEVRGYLQALAQIFTRTLGTNCVVREFGDAECKYDLVAQQRTFTVTAVTDRRNFSGTISGAAPPVDDYYQGGELKGFTGANTDFVREVKFDSIGGTLGNLRLWDELPSDVQIADTFKLGPGCNRLYNTCKDVHENVINFRGYQVFSRGVGGITKGPRG